MKKIISLLLVLLFIPVVSVAADDPFVGIWINDTPSGMRSRTIVTYHVNPSGFVFYSRQEYFFDGSPSQVETAVYTSEVLDESILIKDGDQVVRQLYLVNSYQLSADKRKTYGFYNRVLESEEEYRSAVSYSEKKAIIDPCGKWSYYEGTTDFNNLIVVHDTGVLSYDLYFYRDGSMYLAEGYVKKDGRKLYFADSSGIWIGDSKDLTFRVSDNAYKAYITEDGFLHVRFPSGSEYDFLRVEK